MRKVLCIERELVILLFSCAFLFSVYRIELTILFLTDGYFPGGVATIATDAAVVVRNEFG